MIIITFSKRKGLGTHTVQEEDDQEIVGLQYFKLNATLDAKIEAICVTKEEARIFSPKSGSRGPIFFLASHPSILVSIIELSTNVIVRLGKKLGSTTAC